MRGALAGRGALRRAARASAAPRRAVPQTATHAPVPVSRDPSTGSSKPSSTGRYFTKTHEWFQVEDAGIGTLGITQVAQRALGEVVFCRLPHEGERFGQMDTIATLEAVKSVAEVKSPVHGEVLEVNPRLQREPALVTFAALTEGWLLRMAFSGRVPRYLRRSHAVPRDEVESVLADPAGLQQFLLERLGGGDVAEGELEGHQELKFDGLFKYDRLCVHQAAGALGFVTQSYGVGAGRKLVVRRRKPGDALRDAAVEDEVDMVADDGPSEERLVGRGRWAGRRSS